MNILVTGCAGFIGSHVSIALLKKGYNVIGVDNLNDYYNPKWKKQNLAKFKNETNFTFYRTDITNKSSLEEISNHFS